MIYNQIIHSVSINCFLLEKHLCFCQKTIAKNDCHLETNSLTSFTRKHIAMET